MIDRWAGGLLKSAFDNPLSSALDLASTVSHPRGSAHNRSVSDPRKAQRVVGLDLQFVNHGRGNRSPYL